MSVDGDRCVQYSAYSGGKTGGQEGRWTDRRADGLTGGQEGRWTDRRAGGQMD